ncbi:hypothetical protein DFJ63DRAFT_315802 [Scheffersomyces coipomensis]|uniref:uncharacterized protein n=1 Tax=Scheffersomyces coipomensis TaxID=1788519 RepID=UPI00315C67AC
MSNIPMKMLMFIPSLLDPTFLVKAVIPKRKIKSSAGNRNRQSKNTVSTATTTTTTKRITYTKRISTSDVTDAIIANSAASITNDPTIDDEPPFNVISSSHALSSHRINSFNGRASSPFFETSPINSPFFDGSSYTSDDSMMGDDHNDEEEEEVIVNDDDASIVNGHTRNDSFYTYDINMTNSDDDDDVWSYNPETGHTIMMNDERKKTSSKSVRFS